MTLATRCSACGTSFRVVQDQLKVSGGWVRCGRCNEVFNALDALFEIDTQQQGGSGRPSGSAGPRTAESGPTAPSRTGSEPSGPDPGGAPSPGSPTAAEASGGVAAGSGPQAESGAVPARREGVAASAAAAGSAGSAGSADAELPHAPPLPPSEPAAWDDRPVRGFEDVETRLEPRPGDDLGPMPSFMQHRAAAAEPGPGRRRAALAACTLLAVLLIGQLALAWRDALAAEAPQLKPALVAACRWLNCRVDAPRRMAALSVDGSNLRQRAGVEGYELMVALRNRSASVVMLPAFELTLTDSQGQALIRRVVSAADMGARDTQLGPAGELSLQAVLDVSDRRVAGYTVEIFYP